MKLKPIEEETKPIKDKPNNQSRAIIIFNDLINKRKEITSELYDSVDYNNLKFEYVGPTNVVSFYEYRDSKELFNATKNDEDRFDEARKKQVQFLNKLSNIKIGKKSPTKQKGMINNITRFYNSREESINFFRDYRKMILDPAYKSKQNETKEKGFKILTPKQVLQKLPVALAQVKASNNSERLLSEIRQIVFLCINLNKSLKKYTIT